MLVRKQKLQTFPIFISIYGKVFFNRKKMIEKSYHRLDISGLSFLMQIFFTVSIPIKLETKSQFVMMR